MKVRHWKTMVLIMVLVVACGFLQTELIGHCAYQIMANSSGSGGMRHSTFPLHRFPSARNSSDSIGLKGLEKFDCIAAMEGLPRAALDASLRSFSAVRTSDEEFANRTQDCRTFRERYGYNRYPPTTAEELKFPLAFNILLYKEVEQLHLLLRAIYRPHNSYCLHVDGYAAPKVFDATQRLARCLPNVFLASRREQITYSGFSRLQADINCMADHWNRSLVASSPSSSGSGRAVRPWQYLINLPSQQFPLKTNLELVKILTIYNGSNDIEGITGARMMPQRFKFKHIYRRGENGRQHIVRTKMKHTAPPHELTVVKGSAYGIFSRGFVDFVLHDRRAIDLLEWCREVDSPDEYYWATLHHSAHLQVPGGYHGKQELQEIAFKLQVGLLGDPLFSCSHLPQMNVAWVTRRKHKDKYIRM